MEQNQEPEWIAWHGGECPVPNGVDCEVKFECADGTTDRGTNPETWAWERRNDGLDIVAYRVWPAEPVQPAPSNPVESRQIATREERRYRLAEAALTGVLAESQWEGQELSIAHQLSKGESDDMAERFAIAVRKLADATLKELERTNG